MKKRWFAGVVFLFFYSFSFPVWSAPDLDEAADGACDCLKGPYREAEKSLELIRDAQATGDTSKLMAAQGQMMGVINISNRCFAALAEKYPEIDRSDELKRQVMAKTETLCPNPLKEFQQFR